MSTSTEPNNVWDFVYKKPAQTAASDEKKRTLVTNYVKGQSPDVSLPQVATGGFVPEILGRDIVKNLDIIWYGNLKPITKTTTKQDTVTNPDTGAETVTTTITTEITGYTIDVQFCVGLGPGVRLRRILLDNTSVWAGTQGPARAEFSVANNPFIKDVIFAGGELDQAVDPYLQSVIPQALSGYRGFAYIVLKQVDTNTLGNISVEVDRYPDPLALGAKNKIGDDINPASAIATIISAKWGGAGQDASKIGASFAALGNKLYDEGNGASIIVRNAASANDLNSILLSQIDATLWEDHETGKIEITAFRKDFDRADLVRLFDKDISRINQTNKNSWQSVPTSILLKYYDREANYAEIPVGARNFAVSSKVNKSPRVLSFPAVRTKDLAAKLLAREGATSGSPVQQVTLTAKRKVANSNPGDIILITCEKYDYFSVPAIIVKRRTQPPEDNSVTLVCNVILYPNNNVLFAAPEDSFFVPVDPSPHAPTAAKIVSAPFALRATRPVLKQGVGGSADDLYVGEITSDQILILATAYNQAQQTARVRYHDTGTDTDIIVNTSGSAIDPVSGNAVAGTADFIYPLVGKLSVAIGKYDNWDNSANNKQIIIHAIAPNDNTINAIQAAIDARLTIGCLIMIGNEFFMLRKDRDAGTAAAIFNKVLRTATFTAVRRSICDTVAEDHAVNDDVYIWTIRSGDTSYRGFPFGVDTDFLLTGMSSPKNTLTESDQGAALLKTYAGTDRSNRPLRPHDTKIAGARDATPHALTLGAAGVAITWKIRARNLRNDFAYGDFAWQTDASQTGEVVAGKHIVYRVWIEDSAAVQWDCGATADTADHNSLAITVPAGAAPGVGWLWVDAEFNPGSGVKVSQFKDRLPITLS